MKAEQELRVEVERAELNKPGYDSAYIEGVLNTLRWVLDDGIAADEPPMDE